MPNKKLLIVPALVVLLFILSCWSWVVYHVTSGGQKFGALAEPILAYATLPEMIKEAIKSVNTDLRVISRSYLQVDESFSETNALDYDLYTVFSFWDHDDGTWKFYLVNLRDDQVSYRWRIRIRDVTKMEFDDLMNTRPVHTVLMPDKSLIVKFYSNVENGRFAGDHLLRLDSSSNILWSNTDLRFHHSTELDADGNIWIPSTDLISNRFTGKDVLLFNEYNAQVINTDGAESYFRDEYITKVDPATGEVLYNKSVTQMLLENGYKGLLLGRVEDQFDPIHLNDIQPVLEDTKYWKRGDVFLSSRNMSAVFLFRPAENKIIWLKTGPFLNQHDVDVISDHEISIFNNNHINQIYPEAVHMDRGRLGYKNFVDTLLSNQVVIHDFEKDSSFAWQPHHFIEEKIDTKTEGLNEFLTNGDLFIEETNEGKIFILDKDGFKLKKTFPTDLDGRIYITNWLKMYEKIHWE